MSIDAVQIKTIQHLLQQKDSDGSWLRLLRAFLPLGLADTGQLERLTGLSRRPSSSG
jgi:hypothetical protein